MAKIVARENESLDSMLRRFKRKVQGDNIIGDLRTHEAYVKPSEKRKLKSKLARAQIAKQKAKYLGE